MEKTISRYIVIDRQICHGKPTFRGTRILVSQVLDQVAAGMDWEAISEEWRGSVLEEAIAEAVRFSKLLDEAAKPGGSLPDEALTAEGIYQDHA
jgi:uncharacterized protein (DUF433 family)